MSKSPEDYSLVQQKAIVDQARQLSAALRSKAGTRLRWLFSKYTKVDLDAQVETAAKFAAEAEAEIVARTGEEGSVGAHTYDLDVLMEVIEDAVASLREGLEHLTIVRDPRLSRVRAMLGSVSFERAQTRREARFQAKHLVRLIGDTGLAAGDFGLSDDAFEDLHRAAASFEGEQAEQEEKRADVSEATDRVHAALEPAYQAIRLVELGVDRIERKTRKPVRSLSFTALRTAFHRRRPTDTEEAPVFLGPDEDGLPPLDVVG